MNVHIEKGPTPGKRYGHSLVYYKPFFILFGGNLNNEVANDVLKVKCQFQEFIIPLLYVHMEELME